MNSSDSKNTSERSPLPETYPKTCTVCGKVFLNHDDFFKNTVPLSKGDLGQGPKGSVLVYRNCTCGSTITTKVTDDRDYSPKGIAQREEFTRRLNKLLEDGKDKAESIALIKKEMGIP